MNGLVNGRPEALAHLDHRLAPGEGGTVDSEVVPVSLKNDEIVERKSSVAGETRFAALGAFVNRKLKTMGREILDGTISVAPYKDGGRTACDFCPYHSVCGFDVKTDGYGFRRFDSVSPEEIWEEIEKTGAEKNKGEGTAAEKNGTEKAGKEEEAHGDDMDKGSGSGH